jgi:hypothetical protein
MHGFGNVHEFASKSHAAPRPSCGTAQHYPPAHLNRRIKIALLCSVNSAPQSIKMSFSLLLFATRRPDLSPEEFKAHWETKHVPLIKSIAGDQFPISHTRTYLARPAQAENATWPAAVLVGSQEDFAYDGFAELVFPDEAAFKSFFALVSEPDNAAKIAADEEKFIVREALKAVVIGDKTVTSK